MLYSPLLKQEEKWFKLTFAKTFGTVARDRGKNWPVGSTATKRVKSNRLRLAKQQLCTCITLYLHFFAVTARLRCKNAQFHVFNITSIECCCERCCCERFNKCDFENTCKRRLGINTASKTLRI